MSHATFALFLVTGAAVLALWFDARIPTLAPAGLRGIVLHGTLAFIGIQLIPGEAGSAVGTFVVLFAIALPALIYIFLVAIWFLRHAQGALGMSSR